MSYVVERRDQEQILKKLFTVNASVAFPIKLFTAVIVAEA
jgi:hypothetical protein